VAIGGYVSSTGRDAVRPDSALREALLIAVLDRLMRPT
jgi:hypothetical protein